MGHRHGYCEFDCTYTICDGETKRCKKLESLKQYLVGREWMKMRIKGEKVLANKSSKEQVMNLVKCSGV